MTPLDRPVVDAVLRKTRGAFFTPHVLCRYVTEWAVRDAKDGVLEPSCGEAGFLLAAGERLAALNPDGGRKPGRLAGVEVHQGSARLAEAVLREAGHETRIEVGDFFAVEPRPVYDAVIGNPPYVRYQSFTGGARARSRRAALRAGVSLTALASSWAAFTVHAALFLKRGGRLGLVLPAELLSVNYAAEVRRFLIEKFRTVRLVVFAERVFPGVLEEIVLLLADGFEEGPANHCELYQAHNVADLDRAAGRRWRPSSPGGKWTPSLLTADGLAPYEKISNDGRFTTLQCWGETTLGMVTGNNRYFTMSPASAARHGIGETELVRISPPGSRHLRGLALTQAGWDELGAGGHPTYLFRPPVEPSTAAMRYIRSGKAAEVDEAYKCRVRKPW